MVCKTRPEYLRQWTKSKKSSLNFVIPMVCRELTNHVTDCYLSAIDVNGVTRKNRSSLTFPDLASTRCPGAYRDEIPVVVFGELFGITIDDSSSVEEIDEEYLDVNECASIPFSQEELSDVVHDLSLSNSSDELLATRFKEKTSHLIVLSPLSIATDINSSSTFFSEHKDFVYCTEIVEILHELGVSKYEPKGWKLFIDSRKLSLKCVLLHNGNQSLYSWLTQLH